DQLLSDLAEAMKKKKKRQGSPKTPHGSPPHPPPPSPPPAGWSVYKHRCPKLLKDGCFSRIYDLDDDDTRLKTSVSPIPEELHMDDDTTANEQAYSSSGEDVRRDHIPTVNLRQSWWKPLTEDRPATPEPAWSISSSDLTIPTNN
ncbi:hypothetical protein Tco_0274733, partial [Tanacetum coccineum]